MGRQWRKTGSKWNKILLKWKNGRSQHENEGKKPVSAVKRNMVVAAIAVLCVRRSI